MAEFLDGVDQSGGLAKVADVTVEGGAVTTLTTGAIALTPNKRYDFSFTGVFTGAIASAKLFINGDSTSANYRRGIVSSSGYSGDDSETIFLAATSGNPGFLKGTIIVADGKVLITARNGNTGSAARLTVTSLTHITATTVTELQVTGQTASGLANDTNLKIWEAY